jgi:ATP-dependent helicase/nuclease subunit B
MGRLGLNLITGPANAGKLRRLLDGYVEALPAEPVLIVPTRPDVDLVERELVARCGALLGGSVVTFDDLFRRIARGDQDSLPGATEAQTSLVLARAVASARLNGFAASARSRGFVDSLGDAIRDLESGLLEPAAVEGDLARLYAAYREQLERLGLADRELIRARAARRLASDLDAWHSEPVFAYGFEDLTAAEWSLLEALAGRAELTVSLPYEPGRPAFASLRRTAEDLAALASGRIEELGPRHAEVAHPALAHLERTLFDDAHPGEPPELEGAIRFFEGAGVRGALELVGEEVLELLRGGTEPAEVALVCPTLERWRAPVETAFGTLGIPYSFEAPLPLGATPYGHALLSVLRYAWLGGDRRGELFAYLRSSYSGVPRHNVDFLEGRLRGRAIATRARVEETLEELRPGVLESVQRLRADTADALDLVHELAAAMLRAAYGLEAPPTGEPARLDLRAHEACIRLLDELAGWERLTGETLSRDELIPALERTTVRGASPGEPGRVAVVDLLRARTRRFEAVFLMGLEEGSLPRRGHVSPFLDDDERRRLGARLERPDQVSRDRYLFYTACVRATRRLYLVREAAGDEGSPREPSPFWDEVASVFDRDDVTRWTRRRALSALTWPLEEAPSERERLRALALLASDREAADTAAALARANGWERRLERARAAFTRETRLRHPRVRAELAARMSFNVTELERFADCSSAWLFDRVIDPKTIDAEVDAKLRGQVAHTALHRFYSRLPKELGSEQVSEERVEDAARLMRTCLDEALGGVRMDTTELQRRELGEGLWHDLEQVVRDEARSEVPLVPRRFEVGFGSERSAPELQRGLELGDGLRLSGKIDRIDVDPFSARGIVQDYKAGRHAHSAREIEKELRLQIPLYMLVLRDLVGIEPLGGLYRPLAGERKPRGLLRADAREDALPGFAGNDYLEDDAFWGQVEGAKEKALELAGRIRVGDVRHDPKGDECPAWCDLWRMCRVRRA